MDSNFEIRLLSKDESAVFQPIDKLKEDLLPTSMQVLAFSGRYLDLDKKIFNWPAFKTAIDDYKGDDLTFDKFNQSSINQQTQAAEVMVEKVAKFLHDAFNASIDVAQLAAIILNTFTNLKEKSDSDFLKFSTNKEKHNSSWEYRVLFSVPFGDHAPSYFYSLVTTINITADIVEKTGWFGLTSSTEKNFGVHIEALELVVKKGFRAPLA